MQALYSPQLSASKQLQFLVRQLPSQSHKNLGRLPCFVPSNLTVYFRCPCLRLKRRNSLCLVSTIKDAKPTNDPKTSTRWDSKNEFSFTQHLKPWHCQEWTPVSNTHACSNFLLINIRCGKLTVADLFWNSVVSTVIRVRLPHAIESDVFGLGLWSLSHIRVKQSSTGTSMWFDRCAVALESRSISTSSRRNENFGC